VQASPKFSLPPRSRQRQQSPPRQPTPSSQLHARRNHAETLLLLLYSVHSFPSPEFTRSASPATATPTEPLSSARVYGVCILLPLSNLPKHNTPASPFDFLLAIEHWTRHTPVGPPAPCVHSTFPFSISPLTQYVNFLNWSIPHFLNPLTLSLAPAMCAAQPRPSLIDEWPLRMKHTSTVRITNLYKATMHRFLTKRNRKGPGPIESKPELDLSMALPSSDNFRTSLLMPNLSARFSMLREQDDPMSKLGKAMDDSVLQPSRQSRLYDFGYSPRTLGDIAEVSSITSSVRRPFAENGRGHSFASDGGYHTDDDSSHSGSIMSRSKPGEGNVLFGGRQKIYKIPGKDGSNGLKGRALYDDDVSTSTFQKYRQEERQRQLNLEPAQQQQEPLQSAKKEDVQQQQKSPTKPPSSISGSLKRQTSSSTAASGLDSRASTAATSVTSQGTPSALPSAPTAASTFNFSQPLNSPSAPTLERSTTKRRLYEQGLDRDFQDHQSSAMTRLNSIQKGRGVGGAGGAGVVNGRSTPDLWQARSTPGAQDRSQRPRNASTPPDPPSPPSIFPYSNGSNGQPTAASSENVSPISPSTNQFDFRDHEDGVLASAINPNDRGKATAMGVFNKPQKFSEQQFMERQMTLRKGRGLPPTPRGEALLDSPKESEELDRANMQLPSIPGTRSRSQSTSQNSRSRAASTTQRPELPQAPTAFSVFQNAANQMKTPKPEIVRQDTPLQTSARNKFKFQDDSESDYELEKSAQASQPTPVKQLPTSPRPLNVGLSAPPPQHEHPAFRSSKTSIAETASATAPDLSLHPALAKLEEPQPPTEARPRDSPTLGPTNGGLSGLIRQHLRNVSAQSVYSVQAGPAPTPAFPPALQTDLNKATMQNSSENETTAHSSYSHSNPWDLEDFDGAYYGETDNPSPISPLESGKGKATRSSNGTVNGAGDYRRQALSKASDTAGEAPWQQELRKKTHTRGGSTETQHEREAFQNEIAQRQKAIQEKLREREESERSTSPAPGKAGPFKAMLRQKSSRDSVKKQETHAGAGPKSLKALGYAGSSTNLSNMSSPPMSSVYDRPHDNGWRDPPRSHSRADTREASSVRSQSRSDNREPPRSQSRSDNRDGSRSQSRPDINRPTMPQMPSNPYFTGQPNGGELNLRLNASRESDDRAREDRVREERNRSRANSNVNSVRSRSNSEHSNGRSRSRSGRYRDDLAEAMSTGTSSRTTMNYPEPSPAIPEQYVTPSPVIDYSQHPIPEVPVNALRIHQSRPDAATFEQKGLWPPPKPVGLPSPRSSPGFAPSGNNFPLSPSGYPANGAGLSPALSSAQSPRPSPGWGPMSPGMASSSARSTPVPPFANPTPPISASSTPIASSFPTNNSSTSIASMANNPAVRKGQTRKKSIQKALISEPRLISTTSVIDTVSLEAASLSNGVDNFVASVPPVPPINPRRKRFGFGRSEMDAPEPPFAASNSYSNSYSADEREREPRSRHRLRKTSSDGAKIGIQLRAQREALAMQSSPALTQHLQTSPPRGRAILDGSMF
jgi:hypothetical protein